MLHIALQNIMRIDWGKQKKTVRFKKKMLARAKNGG
jgi:hypothetical protein